MKLPLIPCRHLGIPLTGRQVADAGLGRNRQWADCTHPQQPLGPVVCPCKCRRCPLYSPEDADNVTVDTGT